MTMSSKCHKCDVIAHYFERIYSKDFDPNVTVGYWHCKDHGPIEVTTDTTAQNMVIHPGTTDSTFADSVPGYKAMNRRDRRALERQLRKRR